MAKTVDLQNIKTGGVRPFRFDNAVALLTYEAAIKVVCWKLPDDSNYTFQNGELIHTGLNTVNQGTEKPKRDKSRPR